MPLLRRSVRGWAAVVSLLLTVVVPPLAFAAADFIATIPKDALDTLVNSALVEVRAVGGPGGPLHPAGPKSSNDCESHFVITPADTKWTTIPKPWVAEPPNVCLYDHDGTPPDIDDLRDRWKALKPEWKSYAEMLKDKDVVVEGVPRLWFEHMGEAGAPSSPGHALEIHPATKITMGGRDDRLHRLLARLLKRRCEMDVDAQGDRENTCIFGVWADSLVVVSIESSPPRGPIGSSLPAAENA